MSTEWSPLVSIDTGDGVSAKSRILFTDYRPTYRPIVDRQVDRVSTTLDRYVGRVSIAGIDRHSTAGAFSTYDPIIFVVQFPRWHGLNLKIKDFSKEAVHQIVYRYFLSSVFFLCDFRNTWSLFVVRYFLDLVRNSSAPFILVFTVVIRYKRL